MKNKNSIRCVFKMSFFYVLSFLFFLNSIQICAATSTLGLQTQPAPTSQLAKIASINGVPTLQADGRPVLIIGAQCDIWRSTRQDEQTLFFFDSYKAMNATVVSVGIPWSKIEPTKDHYDFSFLDWFLEQARKRDLHLVINLFNCNVCGKVQEGSGLNAYPQYTPSYILSSPSNYQRMVMPTNWVYDSGGPPMCPNDPRMLERERLLCSQIAQHLAAVDSRGTIVMIQIDNEFYYQQWVGGRPKDEQSIRCHCQYCETKWNSAKWKDCEDFMFHSFADYVRVLTDAITAIHPLPLYVNSPWWNPRVIPIFLDTCSNLAVVGIDGITDPCEPNMLSRSQVSRNILFAAENPTEEPKTRMNLDILPYYTLIGQMGIGNLLWECSSPRTVVEDSSRRQRYANALYPIRWAQSPIANARGTENLFGWFAQREVSTNLSTDIHGNFVSTNVNNPIVTKERFFVREGTRSHMEEIQPFDVTLAGLHVTIKSGSAGILIKTAANELLLALPAGELSISGTQIIECTEGHFEDEHWIPEHAFPARRDGKAFIIATQTPKVIQLKIEKR